MSLTIKRILIAVVMLAGLVLGTMSSQADGITAGGTPPPTGTPPADNNDPDVNTTGGPLNERAVGHVMVPTPVPTATPINKPVTEDQ